MLNILLIRIRNGSDQFQKIAVRPRNIQIFLKLGSAMVTQLNYFSNICHRKQNLSKTQSKIRNFFCYYIFCYKSRFFSKSYGSGEQIRIRKDPSIFTDPDPFGQKSTDLDPDPMGGAESAHPFQNAYKPCYEIDMEQLFGVQSLSTNSLGGLNNHFGSIA